MRLVLAESSDYERWYPIHSQINWVLFIFSSTHVPHALALPVNEGCMQSRNGLALRWVAEDFENESRYSNRAAANRVDRQRWYVDDRSQVSCADAFVTLENGALKVLLVWNSILVY